MKKPQVLFVISVFTSFLFVLRSADTFGHSKASIQIREQEVIYNSGPVIYAEALEGGRWVGRSWKALGERELPVSSWSDEAFKIMLKVTPSPSNEPGLLLATDWTWVSVTESLSKRNPDTIHAVVELSHSNPPLSLKIHTLLDGTPVLTRWLEIKNLSTKAAALTNVSPWSGRLWSVGAPIQLGHSLRSEVPWEGWFGWKELRAGANLFRNDTDRLWDDPYFLLQNNSKGEYFFGQLAWASNYQMEFRQDEGLTFSIGPVARQNLRVIAPGETITAPAVHLGYIRGDFDAAVQAMHEHLRRTILPTREPPLAYRSQYLFPEDQRWSVLHGDDYNVTNLKKCVEVAASAGIDVFILDGPTWISAYGNWLAPKPKWFPEGLKPLVDYVHQKGMLFGAYFETEEAVTETPVLSGMAGHWPGCGKKARCTRNTPNGSTI
ncbi:MAG: alpha-galactosidase [Terriglobia bacterium]